MKAATFTSEFQVNQFLLKYCDMLTADIADERMAEQPLPGVNHPAWILGHLAYSADRAAALLGGEMSMPADRLELFKPGSTVRCTRSDYGPKAELLHTLNDRFGRARERAAAASAEQLAKPNEHPRMKDILPTVQDVVSFLFTGHLGVHLGQLSSWRRMIGLPPMF